MTHRREEISVESEGLLALRDLTDDELEAATGKTRSYFYRIFNPSVREFLQFEDAAALDAALLAKGSAPRFKPLFKIRRNRVVNRIGGRPPHSPEDIDRRVFAVGAVLGDLCQVLHSMRRDTESNALLPTVENIRALSADAHKLMELAEQIAGDAKAAADAIDEARAERKLRAVSR